MAATELAELLDVAPETVVRWGKGKQKLERWPLAILASIVLDRAAGSTATEDRLRAMRDPPGLPAVVRLLPHPA